MLIVIDMQEKYMEYYDSGLVERVNLRITKARDDGEKVIYVRNIGKPENRDDYALAKELAAVNGPVYEKNSPSAFTNPEFTKEVMNSAENELELIGIDGNCCVKKTATDAVNKGFKVFWNESCIGRRDEKIYGKTVAGLISAGVNVI